MRSARVAAAPADGSVAVRTTSLFGVWSRAVERWEELQVGRQGSYSVERLVSLDHYCKTASRTRVILEREQLQALEVPGTYGIKDRFSSREQWAQHSPPQRKLHSVAIVPVSNISVSSFLSNSEFTAKAPPPVSSNKFQHADRSKTLVLQGLQLLFHCEYLALVECVVPLVFATYKSILEQLPNVVYYPGGAGSWGISALANLLVFSALEIMTFVLFVKFLQRKFSFSPLYQLAFVFETQMYLVQAKLLIEIVTLLQSKLAHFGGGYAANIDHKT
ncbi:hypothetical protein PF003_g1072 [Phytophthora fragariae]|nr:hypothetical protein PF003_g1072 [Phytophthora fragariae]